MESDNEEIPKDRRRFFLPGPPIALLMFATALTGTVLTDLIVYRACQVSLNISHSKCFLLRTNASSQAALALETEIQPYASMIVMAKSLIESILPALLSLFFGPWSDRGGRRPLMLAGYFGFTIMFIMLSFLCNWNISPWFLLMPSIPASIMGGYGVVIFASVCHISDTTEEKDRTMLLGWLQASVLGGVLIGIFAGPVIYENWGYIAVFSAASICCTVAFIYTYFFIPETVEDASKESIYGLFKISFVKELVKSSTVKRDGFNRPVVWLSMIILALCLMLIEGSISIEYLFTRERLGWNVREFSYVSGGGVMLSIAGVLCGVSLFSRILGLSDTFLACISLLSAMASVVAKALTKEPWHMYFAVCIGMFGGLVGPLIRSIISKSVPPQDIGKVFSLMSSLETLSPLVGAPIFTQIYSHYLPPIYPLPVYLVAASFYASLIILVLCIEVLLRRARNSQYIRLTQDD